MNQIEKLVGHLLFNGTITITQNVKNQLDKAFLAPHLNLIKYATFELPNKTFVYIIVNMVNWRSREMEIFFAAVISCHLLQRRWNPSLYKESSLKG